MPSDIPVGRSREAEVARSRNTSLTFRTGESDGRRRWVIGDYSSRGQCATRSRRRGEDDAAQAPLPALPASGMTEAHHLKAVAHVVSSNLNAWTGFGIVASTTGRVVSYSVVTSGSGKPGPFRFGSHHPSTHENGCATTGLRRVKNRCTLGIGNSPGGEDHSLKCFDDGYNNQELAESFDSLAGGVE